MTNFIWLLFAHYIGDIALQTESMGKFKKISWVGMVNHCMIWTAISCIALEYLGLFDLWKVVFLFAGHYAMDSWKIKQPADKEHMWCIYLDQSWHLTQLLIVFLIK